MNIAIHIIKGLVRLLLAGVTGWLIHKGIITPEQSESIIAGVAMALVAIAWSVANKYGVTSKIKLALDLPQGTPVEVLDKVAKEQKKGGEV